MKNFKSIIVATFAVFVLLTSAFAQQTTVRASIPFAFTVGQQTLPAGDYLISMNGPAMLRVAHLGGPDAVGLMAAPINGVEKVSPRLIFHRYGEKYFLAQVWVGELNLGHQLTVSPTELRVAGIVKQQTTTIVAEVSEGK